MRRVDLNCDMGESDGLYALANDVAIMPYISSVNIACGFHAGDATVMYNTIDAALQYQLGIGAHPGFADKENFGRKEIQLSAQEIYELIVYQVGALMGFALAAGTRITHVKPHGALYNMAAKQPLMAAAIAKAVKAIDDRLVLYGLSGSHLILEAKAIGLPTASEIFADRTYQQDGSLTPRHLPNALIEDTDAAVAQVLQAIKKNTVTTVDGQPLFLEAETICIHGDGAHAAEFAKAIYTALLLNDISLSNPTKYQ